MRKTVVLLLHLGYWLACLSLFAATLAVATAQRGRAPSPWSVLALYPLMLPCLVPSLLSFYTSYYFLFPRFLPRKRIFALAAAGSVTCLLSASAGSLTALALFGLGQPAFTDAREFLNLTSVLFAAAAVHVVVALVMRGFVDWYGELKLKEELTRRGREMELALIRSRLSPHFLFNTINNIDVLIERDAARASEYLNKLSGILRYMLYEAGAESIPLGEELRFIEKYLELQKLRTANRDYVSYEVRGEAGDALIAPMLFFPLVENAFKHTESDRRANSIEIRVVIEGGVLRFECRNTYRKGRGGEQEFGGLGNELIAKRLALLYPDRHRLELSDAEGIYRVALSLELYGD